jgi:phosphoribosylcarboxyaminoimidazole (NCAIR) mutase
MSLMGEIVALTALAVFQACLNAFLAAVVVLALISPESASRLRRWLAKAREWRYGDRW